MNQKNIALFNILLFSLFWAINIILIKLGLNKGIKPVVLSFQMLAFASILLILYSLAFRLKEIKKLHRSDVLKLLIIGIIGNGIATATAYIGLSLSTSINYGFIIKTGLVFTIVMAVIFLNEKITIQKIVLSIMVLAGVYLISTAGMGYIPQKGDIIILLAALFYSIANIIAKPLLRSLHPDLFAVSRVVFGGLFLFSFVWIIYPSSFVFAHFWLVFQIALAVTLTVIFQFRSIKTATLSYVTMMTMIVPVLVTIIAFFFLGEIINPVQIIGGGLIIISGILINRTNIQAV